MRKIVETASKEMGGKFKEKEEKDLKDNKTINYFTQINQQVRQANQEDKAAERINGA